ncbi:MAG: hypothetical protein HND53_01270 [Proteobacteria bacterium]|nr:hypothetical protein [Pseudomonadota bacterium]NOG59103.1 hypothetical protein [Pseudomonadota bacterium]
MKSNKNKFLFFLFMLLMFQAWMTTVQKEPFLMSDFPKAGSDGLIIDNGKIVNSRTETILWNYSSWIPDSVERKFFTISAIRAGSIRTAGNTLIDKNNLISVNEFILYLPRALHVGLFSPFPQFWSGKGSSPAMTMARKIVGIVTLVFYFCLIGLLFAIVNYRNNKLLWTMVLFCLFGILLYSYTSVNTGTIIRTRYGFYMLLVSFGLAHIVQFFLMYKKNRDNLKNI